MSLCEPPLGFLHFLKMFIRSIGSRDIKFKNQRKACYKSKLIR